MSLSIQELSFARKGQVSFQLGPLDLELPLGKRSVLLGPSGCGKTTLLRIIAGLETPQQGRVQLGEQVFDDGASHLDPQKRRVGFVFQNMALWPHMRADKQIRFAGRCSAKQAGEWLARVGLADKAKRLPGELSGGEGGRLALARALAQEPQLLLLDEPLRSVDPHLREGLQHTIRELSDELGLTTITVTHDREEALALGEHLVLMHEGQVVEAGSVDELWGQPHKAFTASFLRNAHLLPVRCQGAKAETPWGILPIPPALQEHAKLALALVPQDLSLSDASSQQGIASGRILDQYRAPAGWIGEVEVDGHKLHVALPAKHETLGSTVQLELRPGANLVQLDDAITAQGQGS
ncbi:MAG: iron ABC transporter ATP-binding protein [Planctomycetota bacterium]|nr:MAG: iron ABC transporter ATP-binding protein [Planctomycetota bacterium]